MNTAIAVLREAVESGVNHIDTSDYYGPHVINQLIKQALYPYAKDLVIVSKVGARRGPDKSWLHALSRQEFVDAVHDNLRNLGLAHLDVVLRVGGISEPGQARLKRTSALVTEWSQNWPRESLKRLAAAVQLRPWRLATRRSSCDLLLSGENQLGGAARNHGGRRVCPRPRNDQWHYGGVGHA